jgi:hypothetical protein
MLAILLAQRMQAGIWMLEDREIEERVPHLAMKSVALFFYADFYLKIKNNTRMSTMVPTPIYI